MTLLDASGQYPILPRVLVILLVYAVCLGGVLAATAALRGRRWYWLGVVAAPLIIVGAVLSQGFLDSSTRFTLTGLGIALAIFAVALDLIAGPPPRTPEKPDRERIQRTFE